MKLAGWRKLLVALLALSMAFLLALLGKLTADFATVAAVAAGSYNAAHMVQDWRRNGAQAGTAE
jgi:hypothetical protein